LNIHLVTIGYTSLNFTVWPIGQGIVDWDLHLELFDEKGCDAVALFEREAGTQNQKQAEIGAARDYFSGMMEPAKS